MACAHRARVRGGEKRAAQGRMIAPEALGNQGLDRPAEQIRALIAEQALGLRIDHFDQADGANHHHGAWRRLHHLPEALLAFSEHLFDIIAVVASEIGPAPVVTDPAMLLASGAM